MSNKYVDEIFGISGLLMIVYAIFSFDKGTPFPSFYTLIPTLGTGLIILFSSEKTLVGRFLSIKIMVGIGLISYSAYLWHQPLLAFNHHASFNQTAVFNPAIIAIVSFLFAYLSWLFIEKPFRNKENINRRFILLFSIMGTIFFMVVGLVGHYTEGFKSRYQLPQSVENSFLKPHPKNCNIMNIGKAKINVCTRGVKTKNDKIKFAVFGDSHSAAILPAFDSIAHSMNAQYVFMGAGGCPPLLGVDVAKGNYQKGVCESLSTQQFDYVKKHSVESVFLVGRWSLYTDGQSLDQQMEKYFLINNNNHKTTQSSSRDVFVKSLKNTIDAYHSIGVNTYIVEDIPRQNIAAQKLYYKLSRLDYTNDEINIIITKQSVSRSQSNRLQAYNRNVLKQLSLDMKFKIIHLDDAYCTQDSSSPEICLIGNNNHSYYYDHDHLSLFGAMLAKDQIWEIFQPK